MKRSFILVIVGLSFMGHLMADDLQIQGPIHGPYASFAIGRGYSNYSAQNFYTHDLNHDATGVLAAQGAVGFDIDDYFGVEASYQGFMKRTFNNLNNSGWNGVLNEESLQLQTVLRLPSLWGVYGIGKIGPAYQMIEQNVKEGASDTSKPPIFGKKSLWQPAYTIGLQTFLDDKSQLSAAFEYTLIPSNTDNNIPDTEMYLLALILHFK